MGHKNTSNSSACLFCQNSFQTNFQLPPGLRAFPIKKKNRGVLAAKWKLFVSLERGCWL